MATGVLSIAAYLLGFYDLAWLLFLGSLVAFGVLGVLSVLRLALYRSAVADDLANLSCGSAFLTTVAATCILGSQFVIVDGNGSAALALFLLGCFSWITITYLLLGAVVGQREKPPLEDTLDGGWLLLVVSTQSVSTLATLVAPFAPGQEVAVDFLALGAFMLGAMLYIILAALIVYRLIFLPLAPQQFTSSYWISMGAAAITVVAGTTLARSEPIWESLQAALPMLVPLVLMFWAVASWWIPLLITLGLWSRLQTRFSLEYKSSYWALVFPLGMYATSTFELGKVLGLSFLFEVAYYMFLVAFLVWVVVLLGLIHSGLRRQ